HAMGGGPAFRFQYGSELRAPRLPRGFRRGRDRVLPGHKKRTERVPKEGADPGAGDNRIFRQYGTSGLPAIRVLLLPTRQPQADEVACARIHDPARTRYSRGPDL